MTTWKLLPTIDLRLSPETVLTATGSGQCPGTTDDRGAGLTGTRCPEVGDLAGRRREAQGPVGWVCGSFCPSVGIFLGRQRRGRTARKPTPLLSSPFLPCPGLWPDVVCQGSSPQSCCASHRRTLLQHKWGWVQFPHIAGGIRGSRLPSGLRLPDESGLVGPFSPSSFLGGGFPDGRHSLKLGHHLTNMY